MNKECLNCKTPITGKKTYCSDKCRIAYTRRTKQGQEPEQIQPEQTRTGLTRTDALFERKRPGYYAFDETPTEKTCTQCSKVFKTQLRLLKFCSPTCMSNALTVNK